MLVGPVEPSIKGEAAVFCTLGKIKRQQKRILLLVLNNMKKYVFLNKHSLCKAGYCSLPIG